MSGGTYHFSLPVLEGEMDRLLGLSVAKGSLSTYYQALRAFHNFRVFTGSEVGNFLPSSSEEVARFVAYLSLRHYSPASVATYLSGLAFFLKLNNLPNFTSNFVIRKLVEGLRRERPQQDCRQPITLPLLARILGALPAVCMSVFECCLFRAAFSLAFFAFLRVGEVVLGSSSGTHVIQFCNVTIQMHSAGSPSGISLFLPSSKTDQVGVGASIFLAPAGGSPLCPVQLLWDYLQVRPAAGGQLFCHFDGSPVTRYQFSRVLDRAIAMVGPLGSGHFRSHSFRIGAATCAALLGFSSDSIQAWGRWKSSCFLKYIRPPVQSFAQLGLEVHSRQVSST